MTGVIHVVLSILFTAIFTVVASAVATMTMGELLSTAGSLALAGILFGISLWLVNFYLIAPVAGWTWSPERTDPLVQFLAHGRSSSELRLDAQTVAHPHRDLSICAWRPARNLGLNRQQSNETISPVAA